MCKRGRQKWLYRSPEFSEGDSRRRIRLLLAVLAGDLVPDRLEGRTCRNNTDVWWLWWRCGCDGGQMTLGWQRSVGSRRELCRQFCARPEEHEAMVWFGCVQRMSLVYVCAEGEGFGDTFSRRHAERLDAAGGQHGWGGAYYLAALNTYSCSRSCFKLVALFSNSVRLTNHTPWKETVHSGITIL